MQVLKIFLFTSILGTSFLAGQTLEEAAKAQRAKLEDAISRLNAQRSEIQAKQIPLGRELRQKETEAAVLEDKLREARKIDDSRALDLQTLRETVASYRKETDYISRTLFGEYTSSYESGLSVAEMDTFGRSVRELNLFFEDPDATPLEQLKQSIALIGESMERIQTTIGGKTFSGQALNSDGALVDGEFIQIGPLVYFIDVSGVHAGVVEESKSLQARIQNLDEALEAEIVEVSNTKSGMLPMDLSLGNALAIASTKDSIGEHLEKGGIWVYPIVGFAILSTIVALIKFAQIMTIRHPAPSVIHDLVVSIRDGNQDEALALARNQPQPSQDMLVQGVQHSEEAIELVEEAMYESMLNTQPKLSKYLNVIAVTASVAPLFGLLGTVTGIIKTFNLMKVFGAGDPKPLISGISEALITTELGLVLAIPALIIHAILSRKVAGVMAHTERLSVAFVNGLSRQAPK
ncbi:MAG: MotA/TolQ/ExbB proton channel family protein [Verrucomicrobiota bacterium]